MEGIRTTYVGPQMGTEWGQQAEVIIYSDDTESDYLLPEGSLSQFAMKCCSQWRLVVSSITGNTVPTCRQDIRVTTHTQGGTEVSGTGTGRLRL